MRGIQNPGLPTALPDGHAATWYYELKRPTDWLEHFANDFLSGPFPRLSVYFCKVQAFTSTGQTFMARIDASLRRELADTARKQRRERSDKSPSPAR